MDTESIALIMEDINVASHDQEHSLNSNEFEETACTELPESININSTVKEISADENSKETELQHSESSLDEIKSVSHCHNPVTGGDLNHLSINNELSHRKLVAENEGTEDHKENVIAMDELSADKNITL